MKTVEEALKQLKCIYAIIDKRVEQERNILPGNSLLAFYYWYYKIVRDKVEGAKVRNRLIWSIEQFLSLQEAEEDVSFILNLVALSRIQEEKITSYNLLSKIKELEYALIEKVFTYFTIQGSTIRKFVLDSLNYFVAIDANREFINLYHLKDLIQILSSTSAFPFRPQPHSPQLVDSSGNISLGLERGIAGILILLINAYQKGITSDVALKESIDSAIKYIASLRRDIDFSENRYNVFPDAVSTALNQSIYTEALSWSSGDLAITVMLYKASELFDDADLRRMADLVGLNTLLRRSVGSTAVSNSSFSQGSSGLAYTYHYLYNLSRRNAYQDGYNYWIEQTFKFLKIELMTGFYNNKELDVQNGLTGVGLVLIDYLLEDDLLFLG